MIGIYKITEINNPTMFYVGKSNNIERRFSEHQTKTYKQSRIPFDKYKKEKGDSWHLSVWNRSMLENWPPNHISELPWFPTS